VIDYYTLVLIKRVFIIYVHVRKHFIDVYTTLGFLISSLSLKTKTFRTTVTLIIWLTVNLYIYIISSTDRILAP